MAAISRHFRNCAVGSRPESQRHAPILEACPLGTGCWKPDNRQARTPLKPGGFWTCASATRSLSSTGRSEEHTSELQSLMRNTYAVFCLKKKKMRDDEER